MKYILLLLIVLSVAAQAQTVQADSLDKLSLRNNRIINGHVIKLTSETIQFRESGTNLVYEFQKNEVKDLRLSNGVVMTFNSSTDNSNVTGSTQQTVQPGTNTNTSNNAGTANNTGQQQQTQNQQKQDQGNKVDQELGGMSTTAILLLGAAGVIVLLLLGSAIF